MKTREKPLTCCLLLALLFAWTASAATTSNDDSCDIGVAPAATLLLPYFEVDVDNPGGERTIFTITNVTNVDRIARVTLWTDYAFPVLTFNVQLTGYGVQSISLYDVIERGIIGPETSIARGRYSKSNPASACEELPRTLPPESIEYLQSALLEGIAPADGAAALCNTVGGEHDNAVGYATVDLVRNCSTNNPLAEQYWSEDIAFDNVLIGDYQQIDSDSNFAQGAPMVHVRAIPEGGTPAERMAHQNEHGANLPRTFYGRYQPWYAPKLDSRQPLPSVFAARWIRGGVSDFQTDLLIWREGRRGREATCATYDDNDATYSELVVFDEAENMVADVGSTYLRVAPSMSWSYRFTLPATLRAPIDDGSYFPQIGNGAIGGWVYLSLDNDDSSFANPWASQNWVVTSMRAEGRYSTATDAAALGNGCSAQAESSEMTTGTEIIRPRP